MTAFAFPVSIKSFAYFSAVPLSLSSTKNVLFPFILWRIHSSPLTTFGKVYTKIAGEAPSSECLLMTFWCSISASRDEDLFARTMDISSGEY